MTGAQQIIDYLEHNLEILEKDLQRPLLVPDCTPTCSKLHCASQDAQRQGVRMMGVETAMKMTVLMFVEIGKKMIFTQRLQKQLTLYYL